jgi:5-(carboxyamino)imidazole ribonucleotide mutase
MAATPLVGILMGSKSDLPVMQSAADTLQSLGIPHEMLIMSAHRTPDAVAEYARSAEGRGLKVLIAAAGMAAHLAGVVSAYTILPVMGVPMESPALKGLDSLLAISQMPAGGPVGTTAIGKAGAVNAALLAAAIIGLSDEKVKGAYRKFREDQTKKAMAGQKAE